ncbi:nucleotide exchange factor GrpE [Corynebacterium lizhenjunii]|uniref:Protein GrpE n=1 Tax=Corynebacterium lizhenjunii TaxID=2709394 RepID=A0A7T0KE77_9CORY|nr:nucleotide exchange factor GrpE [Corynebacterium lizhenjunii]QPK78967.1 nucleotide exchange factor GrpE [Corynebacterium lizhenjunii]
MTTPQDPGHPDNTDPEATSPEQAEAAASAAEAADAASGAEAPGAEVPGAEPGTGAPSEPELDPTLEADLEAALADAEFPDSATGAAADAAADAASDATVAGADAASDAAETGEADAAEADAIAALQAQLAERTEDLQRLNAEYTNYRRRTERERQAVVETAKAKVLGEFLPILDDLELARQHGDLDEGPLKAIADKLSAILRGQNVESFGDEGDAFDPEIHEAVQDLSSGGEQVLGTILRRGYRVGDKLIRTAMVIIADAPAASVETPSEQ